MAASSRSAQRAASKAAMTSVSPPVLSVSGVPESATQSSAPPLTPGVASEPLAGALAPLVAPEPDAEPARQVAPAPERQYSVEVRLDSAALTGESAYHVVWPESRVRRLLSGALMWAPIPPSPHLPGQAAPDVARFVYIQSIQQILIHGWPQDDLGQ